MSRAFAVQAFITEIAGACSFSHLDSILQQTALAAGFRYFAVIEHNGGLSEEGTPLRLHNYPPGWVSFHEHRVGSSDPIWSVSERCSSTFTWAEAAANGHLTPAGRAILDHARVLGVLDGVTVPGNVARQRGASCSFATPIQDADPANLLPALQFIGTTSLDTARRLKRDQAPQPQAPRLTVRQKECILWVARGKGDWEIAQILGVSRLTVTEHLKRAQQTFDVCRRTALLSKVIRAGLISIDEI